LAKQLAVVGSGTGGTFAANTLSSKLHKQVREGKVQIVLIGEGFRHHFQPANLDIAFKGAHPDDQSRSEMDLLNEGVTFIPDPAEKIDLENRSIVTTGGDVFDYDKLILATGAEASPHSIPGLAEGSVCFHTGQGNAVKVWESVSSFKKGRIGVLIAGVPHKCPPSPDEALFLLDEYLRHRKVRREVELTLLTPYPRSYPAERIAKVVGHLFDERGINVIPFFNVDTVDPAARKVFSLEGDEFEYDLLIAIPPHRGTGVIRKSGLGDEEGWIRTDKKTMRVRGHDDVFAIGDATDIPISKSGVVAHLQSKVVASNIAFEIEGKGTVLEYNGRINCPMETGHRQAIFVSATYQRPPADQSPSFLKYAMKKGFGAIYWSALTGRWEWLLDTYLGDMNEESGSVPFVG